DQKGSTQRHDLLATGNDKKRPTGMPRDLEVRLPPIELHSTRRPVVAHMDATRRIQPDASAVLQGERPLLADARGQTGIPEMKHDCEKHNRKYHRGGQSSLPRQYESRSGPAYEGGYAGPGQALNPDPDIVGHFKGCAVLCAGRHPTLEARLHFCR